MDYTSTVVPTIDVNQQAWGNIFKGSLILGGLVGVIWLIGIILGIVFYIYLAICLMTLAKKTNVQNPWMSWIPILNLVLMVHIAKKPTWMFLLFLVPVVNLVALVFIWMEIAKARNKPDWVGILMIVPIVGFFVPAYLAFSK